MPDRAPKEEKNKMASSVGKSIKEIAINLANLKSQLVNPHTIKRTRPLIWSLNIQRTKEEVSYMEQW